LRFERSGAGVEVLLSDSSRVAADCVIIGVGAVPEVGLAAAAGLEVDNGIAVDEHLQTSDPNIFAAGDCASVTHPLYGGQRVRLESWRNAQEQGALATRNMLGARARHDAVPWFWSDQYELCLQVTGLPHHGTQVIERAVGNDCRLLLHLLPSGALAGASGVGPPGHWQKELRVAELLIARGTRVEAAALASPALRLKTLLAA
jgi:3-phenylpropionate/trans-cinnamate dioxygenase ferredoxin reductase subunit